MAQPTRTTAKKAAPKRKPAAKRKPAPKRKAAAAATAKKAVPDFAARAQQAGRGAFLAGLGLYGKAFDQAQEQFDSLQGRLTAGRKDADKLYQELVKRGQKVEKDARKALGDLDLPRLELDSLADRKKIEARLKQVRARFNELKDSVSIEIAA